MLSSEQLLNHYYISRSWLISQNARRIYRTAAACSLLLILVFVAYDVKGDTLFANEPMEQLARLTTFVGVLGAAITLVAMEYYFFTLDECGVWTKTLWFLLLCAVPIGTALYCFRVYSRSSYFRHTAEDAESTKPSSAF